jgi:ribokinase
VEFDSLKSTFPFPLAKRKGDIGLGALNMDNIYRVERILGDDEAVAAGNNTREYQETEKLGKFPGGSAANTIYGLAKLGISTGFIGAVGGDTEGKDLLADFRKAGVDTRHIKINPKAKTGAAICLSDTLNFRSIRIIPGANDLLVMDEIDLPYINQADMLHIASFAGDRQFKLSLELPSKLDSSVKVSFSPGALYAAKGLKVLRPILARTHVLFTNNIEMRQLTGEDFDSGAQTCLQMGCRIVVVTLGKGTRYKDIMATSYVRSAEKEYIVEPLDKSITSASDTIGAGDAFAAGFLHGLLHGKELEECGRLGDIVARFSITRAGARPGLPTLAQLSRRYRQLYNKKL